jgi:hypothetical protein
MEGGERACQSRTGRRGRSRRPERLQREEGLKCVMPPVRGRGKDQEGMLPRRMTRRVVFGMLIT